MYGQRSLQRSASWIVVGHQLRHDATIHPERPKTVQGRCGYQIQSHFELLQNTADPFRDARAIITAIDRPQIS